MTAVVAQYRGTEPPPGYEWSGDSRDLVHAVGRPGGPPLHGPVSLSQAWSEYRITHDPPGMWSSPTFKGSFGVLQSPSPSARGHDGQLILIKTTLRVGQLLTLDRRRSAARDAARVSAWVWYDVRASLSATHEVPWPDCLEWTEADWEEALESPMLEERCRQRLEHMATTLDLLDFSGPPPSDTSWPSYKSNHNPPGMWCGFSRTSSPEDSTCSFRVGVSACGARWELNPSDSHVPYKGWLAKARAWAWTWHDRRHALAKSLLTCPGFEADGRSVMFHRILCWHDEWVVEAEDWVRAHQACPGSTAMPDAFATLTNPCEVKS